MNRFLLDDSERREVRDLVDDVMRTTETWDPANSAEELTERAQELPLRLRRFLAATRLAEVDVAVVSGLPLSVDLEPTPIGWDLAAKTGAGTAEEVLLMLVGSAMGDPFAWTDQQNGRMVHDVCPAPGHEHGLTSASSQADLSLHTEDVHHPCRGDYVALLCLRNHDQVGTTFVRVDSLDVPADVRSVLEEPRFRFHADDSHVGAESYDVVTGERLTDRTSTVGPVVFGPKQHPYLRIDLDFTSAATEGDTEVETAMRQAFESLRGSIERVVMEPGDLVFMDNYRVVHGREPFQPRYDGTDRWLKRVNLIRDIRRVFVQESSRSRVIS